MQQIWNEIVFKYFLNEDDYVAGGYVLAEVFSLTYIYNIGLSLLGDVLMQGNT